MTDVTTKEREEFLRPDNASSDTEEVSDKKSASESTSPLLYHYTSIQVLALILNNRTIRFSKLSKVNDPLEGIPVMKGLNDYLFVSCWSREHVENLYMWRMYAGLDGVRIGLPEDIFTTFPKKPENVKIWDHEQDVKVSLVHGIQEAPQGWKNINIIASFCHDIKEKQGHTMYGPDDMHYYKDDFVDSNIKFTHSSIPTVMSFAAVGIAKIFYWQFEDEVRFRIPFKDKIPLKPEDRLDIVGDHIDVGVKDSAFNGIKVVVGPENGKANEIIVKALLKAVGISDDNVTQSRIEYRSS